MKRCSRCNETKPNASFYSEPRNSDGLLGWCKDCKLEYNRVQKLRQRYGIDAAEYESMYRAQDGVCAICRNTCSLGRQLSVDHCHESGEVRGLLCSNCNTALGKLHTTKLLTRAILYLEGEACQK